MNAKSIEELLHSHVHVTTEGKNFAWYVKSIRSFGALRREEKYLRQRVVKDLVSGTIAVIQAQSMIRLGEYALYMNTHRGSSVRAVLTQKGQDEVQALSQAINNEKSNSLVVQV